MYVFYDIHSSTQFKPPARPPTRSGSATKNPTAPPLGRCCILLYFRYPFKSKDKCISFLLNVYRDYKSSVIGIYDRIEQVKIFS